MKIAPEQMRSVVDALKEFGARRVIIFGSYLESPENAHDIDIGVEGIPPRRLGAAELAVYRLLRLPFDLVSREETPQFFSMIEGNANTLYES
jgi:predicted nucleotidyltransferase